VRERAVGRPSPVVANCQEARTELGRTGREAELRLLNGAPLDRGHEQARTVDGSRLCSEQPKLGHGASSDATPTIACGLR